MTEPGKTHQDDETVLLHAHLDGELDPANALAIERQIAANPALAAEQARIEALRQALRQKFPPEALPHNLRLRIEAATGLHRTSTGPSWRALAASVILGMVLASGSTWWVLRPATSDRIAGEVVGDHLRALMAPQPFDVASSDRHTVKPWFSGRIPQAPRVVDLSADGFTLVGGRIDVIDRTPVPTLVYRIRAHLISLMQVPAAGRAGEGFVQRSLNGFNIVGWTQDGVAYWAVSDVAAADLDKFAQAFRAAPADR